MSANSRGPILGIDYGTKRIGLAISDPDGRVAVPRAVMANKGSLAQVIGEIVAAVQQEGIVAIVVGLPKSQRGKTTDMTTKAMEFATALRRAATIPVIMADERMTSSSVLAAPGGIGSAPIDARAATVLLQDYLDQQ